VHYLEELGCDVTIKRNDQFDLEEISSYDSILLSPGPGIPDEAGLLKSTIEKYASTHKIMGVCLGHQAIGEVFGATLINLKEVYHGVESSINIVKNDFIFKNLPNTFMVGRYHSWSIQNPLPECLEITSIDDQGQIMSLRHKEFNIRGVQFHPESVLTPNGKQILKNWISN